MFKELIHFVRHAPGTLALLKKLSHAELYDRLMLKGEEAGMAAWRAALTAGVRGKVLEIGCGTGLMFPYYAPDVRLAAVELEPEFLELAKGRADEAAAKIRLFVGDGAHLPFSARHFDYVIVSLVLCSVGSVEDVLTECRRVLAHGGELRLIEHVRSDRPVSGAVMDLLNPLWLRLNRQGCHMNRKTEVLIQQSDFIVDESRPFKIFAPGIPAFPMRWMRVRPR